MDVADLMGKNLLTRLQAIIGREGESVPTRPSNTADALDRGAIVLLDRTRSYPSVAGSSRRRPPEEIELGCLIRTRRDQPD
jgi:hypothetical protein